MKAALQARSGKLCHEPYGSGLTNRAFHHIQLAWGRCSVAAGVQSCSNAFVDVKPWHIVSELMDCVLSREFVNPWAVSNRYLATCRARKGMEGDSLEVVLETAALCSFLRSMYAENPSWAPQGNPYSSQKFCHLVALSYCTYLRNSVCMCEMCVWDVCVRCVCEMCVCVCVCVCEICICM